MPEGFCFRPEQRIRNRSQFLQLYREAQRFHTPYFVLYIRENKLEQSRLGITVSRKIGKPVARNRIKRRIREVFRQRCNDLQPSADMVVNAKRRAALAAFAELERSFCSAVKSWRRKREAV